MATNTYVALSTTTVSTATPSVTFNLSGITGYTDLVLVANVGTSTAGPISYQVGNGTVDTGSNYSRTCVYGDGASAASFRETNQTYFNTANGGTSVTVTDILHFMNYSNTTTYKTILNRNGRADATTQANVYLWRSTSAINTIKVFNANGYNLIAGSTFTIYGIAAAAPLTAKATGGTIFYGADGYVYHKFSSSGTFTPTQSLSADILVVAGGGGGGGHFGGGGGAGGLLGFTAQALTTTGYTVTVGGPGAGGNYSASPYYGASGSPSQFGALTATVGGGGGATRDRVFIGRDGGSGGGGTQGNVGGAGTSGQGYAGGTGIDVSPNYAGGGGGGAGGVGQSVTSGSSIGGNGGIGSSDYTNWAGASTVDGYYAGGGGGGSAANPSGIGGLGGGGNGGTTPTAGVANTGGGGGGKSVSTGIGGAGGSGVVIVRYLAQEK